MWKDKRVIVTGAASGIGAATARLLADDGARLVLIDHDEKGVQSAATAWGQVGFAADLRDEISANRAIIEGISVLGGLDVLVNCAGVATTARLEDTSFAEWRRQIDTNLTGVFLTCRAAAGALKDSGAGAIVNLASASGLSPSFAGAAYSASKAGVIMLSKALARELAPHVRVNAVCPGSVRTPMFRAMTHDDAAAESAAAAGYALGRIADPEEVARAVRFLAGDDSGFVTGVALAVDGGRSFH